MGYHPRIECSKRASFLTTRSRNSELWFVNNTELETAILGYTAKYSNKYSVKLYALAIEGNHVQGPAHFEQCNRASFMRDLNSNIARAVPRHCPTYPGGRFWGRRYSAEFLPEYADIEKQFFYTVLQPVQDGLVPKISEYPGYNCFHDAVWGITKKFKLVRWGDYNAAKRYNKKISIKDYTDVYELKYERLPGYEHLSQKEYAKLMHKKLEEHRVEIVKARLEKGEGFAGREALLETIPGSRPKKTKTSTRSSHRARILCGCPVTRASELEWYFGTYEQYKEASKRYRDGEYDVEFPPGTFRPPEVTVRRPAVG